MKNRNCLSQKPNKRKIYLIKLHIDKDLHLSLINFCRGEIEELYEKVTCEEYQKSIAAGDMGRADSMRALMLVLPYNTDNNTEENIQVSPPCKL